MSCVANRISAVKNTVLLALLALLLPQPVAKAVQSVALSWNASASAGVVGYKIYCGANSGVYTNVIDVGNSTNVMIPALPDGSTNYFSATTYDASTNESSHSAEVVFVVPVATNAVTNIVVDPGSTNSVTPNNPPTLNAVNNVLVTTNPADASSLMVTWNASTDAGIVGYQVYFGTASGNYSVVTNLGLVNSLVITGLVAGTTNYFAVREYDAAWNASPMSSEASLVLPLPAKLPPTLNPIADITVNMNTSWRTVILTGVGSSYHGSNAVLRVTATSANSLLIAAPKISYTNGNSAAVLKFKPVSNASGNTTISVTVTDGSTNNNFITQTFKVTVINTVRLLALPKITRQPASTNIAFGRRVALSVGVSGRAPFTFQWMCNGTNIPGATAASLAFRNATTNQTGNYSVLISNNWGATNSAIASVYVMPPSNAISVIRNIATVNRAPVLAGGATTVATRATTITAGDTNTIPTLTPPSWGNGHFNFQVTGLTGAKYVVLATEDLSHWAAVETNTAPFTYIETNTVQHSKRFYRAVYQP